MVRDNRRQFLKGMGALATAGLAGCTGDGGSGDGGGGGGGSDLTSVTIQLPEGTIHYPMYEAAVDNGLFEEEGVDLTVEYPPFDAQVQSITSGEVDTAMVSMIPYMNNQLRGEDLVTFGWNGCLQSINALYTRADSEYESIGDLEGQRIGVWSWGSSTVQAFQAVVADQAGLNLRQDFETTTAAPPALLGLLQDEEVDGIINVSGLTITMESQPDSFRNLTQLNSMWIEQTDHTLPLTSWWSYADWYEDNTDTAAALLRGASSATEYWRENTADVLEEYGEPAAIDNDAKIEVVEQWSEEGQIWTQEADESYIDATWQFVELMNEYDFMEDIPDRDEVIRNPL